MTNDAKTGRHAVYALSRSLLEWVPDPAPRTSPPTARFEHHPDAHTLTCPDCLADDFAHTFGCETCNGARVIPGPQRDPYETREATRVGGLAGEHQHERRRYLDSQLAELRRLARVRAGEDDPEDWYSRASRLKAQQANRGDYLLLEQALQLLQASHPMRWLAWVTFVVEAQPLSVASATKVRLDETADWLAGKMLAAVDARIAALEEAGVRRLPARELRVPVEHWDAELRSAQEQAGRGRWANAHAQGERNAVIAGMLADGRTAGEIARRVGLTKRRVQQLAAELQVLRVATGPAA